MKVNDLSGNKERLLLTVTGTDRADIIKKVEDIAANYCDPVDTNFNIVAITTRNDYGNPIVSYGGDDIRRGYSFTATVVVEIA